jgi:beta-lactamase regulating signal transducer with metallopeptidase domain
MTAMMIEAALRALVFAVAVGLALRLFQVSNVPAQKAAWSLVLIASVTMPFVMRSQTVTRWSQQLGWAVPIPASRSAAPPAAMEPALAGVAPVAPATEGRNVDPREAMVARSPIAISAAVDDTPAALSSHAESVPGGTKLHWPPTGRMIAMIYMSIAGALLIRLLWGLGVAVRLWITADLVSPLIAPEPNVRSSARIPSPVTIGSGIVLPANYAEWDRKKLRMVLAHERSHVRQLDFYLQLLAGVYTTVFWFSPLGWWLKRTLSSLGEAIGDRAGMDAAASRSGYAAILLEFAAMPHKALPGVAMARHGNLSRRIERLLNEHLFQRAFAEGRQRAIASLLLIPMALFGATALIRVPGASAQEVPSAPAVVPKPAPAPAAAKPTPDVAPAAPEPEQVAPPAAPLPGAPTSAGVPAVAPAAPGVPVAPAILSDDAINFGQSDGSTLISNGDQQSGYAYHFSDDGESYAIVNEPGTKSTFSGDWGGNRMAELEAARKVAKGPFLWFTHQGKSYVVSDPDIVARIQLMYKPMQDLGRRQELLGKQQEALGKQQEVLAHQQEEAGQVKMPDMSKEMADLNAALAKVNEEQNHWNTKEFAEAEAKLKAAQDQMMTPEKLAEMQANLAAAQSQMTTERMAEMEAKLGELQSRLGELQGEAGARQGEFGVRMGKLGAEQGVLGEQQGRLGAEQGRIAQRADQQIRSIIDESLHNGKAIRVPDVH